MLLINNQQKHSKDNVNNDNNKFVCWDIFISSDYNILKKLYILIKIFCKFITCIKSQAIKSFYGLL